MDQEKKTKHTLGSIKRQNKVRKRRVAKLNRTLDTMKELAKENKSLATAEWRIRSQIDRFDPHDPQIGD